MTGMPTNELPLMLDKYVRPGLAAFCYGISRYVLLAGAFQTANSDGQSIYRR